MACRCHACWHLRQAVLDPLQSKALYTMSKARRNNCDADFVVRALFVLNVNSLRQEHDYDKQIIQQQIDCALLQVLGFVSSTG